MLLKHYINMRDTLEESSLCYLWPNESSISDLPKNKSATPSFANLPFIPPCPSVLLFIVPLVSYICCVQTLSHSANLLHFQSSPHFFFTAFLSCVGGGVKQKVVGALQVPCKGATFATSTSQIAPHTPTLWFGRSNWTMHLKRMLAKRLPRRAQTRGDLSSEVTRFASSNSAAFGSGWLTFGEWLPVPKWSLCRQIWWLLLQTVEPRSVQPFSF